MLIKYTDSFLQDFKLRLNYFEEIELYEGIQNNRLRNKLREAIREIEELLIQFPHIKSPDKSDICHMTLNGFKGKMLIYYRVKKETIEFYKLFHSSQKPIN